MPCSAYISRDPMSGSNVSPFRIFIFFLINVIYIRCHDFDSRLISDGISLIETSSTIGCRNLTDLIGVGLHYSPGPQEPSHMLEGTTVKVWCETGYNIEGSSELMCINGYWRKAGAFPFCKPVDCGEPPELLSGHGYIKLRTNVTEYEAEAEYRCDEGYELRYKENDVSHCMHNGMWNITTPDEKPPQCVPMYCGNPDMISISASKNRRRRGGDWTYQGEVSFDCDPGYDMIVNGTTTTESPTIKCKLVQDKSEVDWVPQPRDIKCVAVSCGPPAVPKNGHVIEYIPGFSMECTKTGVPSSKLEAELLKSPPTTFPHKVQAMCDCGYDLPKTFIGRVSSCQADGEWSVDELPDCVPKEDSKWRVRDSSNTSHGAWKVEHVRFFSDKACRNQITHVGAELESSSYKCGMLDGRHECFEAGNAFNKDHSLFWLSDDTNVTSSKDGPWIGVHFPKSTYIKCIQIGQEGVKISSLLTSQSSLNAVAESFMDIENSYMMTPSLIQLNDFSTTSTSIRGFGARTAVVERWTGSDWEEVLLKHTRQIAEDPEKTSLQWQDVEFGKGGFNMTDSHWTMYSLFACPELAQPFNGRKVGSGYQVDAIIKFYCYDGFARRGPQESICYANETNSHPIPPLCEPVECDPNDIEPHEDQHHSLLSNKFTFGSQVDFECDRGYYMEPGANNSTRCRGDGSWSDFPPICTAVDCGTFPFAELRDSRGRLTGSVEGGGLTEGSETTFSNKVFFKCDEGLAMRGPPESKCEPSGKWTPSPETMKTCEGWIKGHWMSCQLGGMDVICGPGTRSRPVSCTDEDDPSCSVAVVLGLKKPAQTEKCWEIQGCTDLIPMEYEFYLAIRGFRVCQMTDRVKLVTDWLADRLRLQDEENHIFLMESRCNSQGANRKEGTHVAGNNMLTLKYRAELIVELSDFVASRLDSIYQGPQETTAQIKFLLGDPKSLPPTVARSVGERVDSVILLGYEALKHCHVAPIPHSESCKVFKPDGGVVEGPCGIEQESVSQSSRLVVTCARGYAAATAASTCLRSGEFDSIPRCKEVHAAFTFTLTVESASSSEACNEQRYRDYVIAELQAILPLLQSMPEIVDCNCSKPGSDGALRTGSCESLKTQYFGFSPITIYSHRGKGGAVRSEDPKTGSTHSYYNTQDKSSSGTKRMATKTAPIIRPPQSRTKPLAAKNAPLGGPKEESFSQSMETQARPQGSAYSSTSWNSATSSMATIKVSVQTTLTDQDDTRKAIIGKRMDFSFFNGLITTKKESGDFLPVRVQCPVPLVMNSISCTDVTFAPMKQHTACDGAHYLPTGHKLKVVCANGFGLSEVHDGPLTPTTNDEEMGVFMCYADGFIHGNLSCRPSQLGFESLYIIHLQFRHLQRVMMKEEMVMSKE
eukprot:GHVL01032196.1.p1 GENE.GHVL01032196.1~~GHVL01032196.1.p1  ORF type:complete len:1385 (+),score=197.21 GHVL01032196.1:108-4262(+)